jgi:OOP family OmpA-OmpF porin
MSNNHSLKLGLASIIILSASHAMAGQAMVIPEASISDSGFYAGINGGYASGNRWGFQDGFAGGLDAGFQFNRYISLEAGWMRLPGTWYNNADFTRGFSYVGPKFSIPLIEGTSLFGKAAVAFTYEKIHDYSDTYTSPLFAVGLEHNFTSHLSANVQVGYLTGPIIDRSLTRGQFISTVGLGFKF